MTTDLTTALIGLAMAVGGLIWWFRRVGRVQIPKNRMPFLIWMLVAAALGGVALVAGSGWQTVLPAVLALVGGLFVLLTVSISRQKVEGAIGVGDLVPAFQALDENGEIFDGASLVGHPVLFKFFRGHW